MHASTFEVSPTTEQPPFSIPDTVTELHNLHRRVSLIGEILAEIAALRRPQSALARAMGAAAPKRTSPGEQWLLQWIESLQWRPPVARVSTIPCQYRAPSSPYAFDCAQTRTAFHSPFQTLYFLRARPDTRSLPLEKVCSSCKMWVNRLHKEERCASAIARNHNAAGEKLQRKIEKQLLWLEQQDPALLPKKLRDTERLLKMAQGANCPQPAMPPVGNCLSMLPGSLKDCISPAQEREPKDSTQRLVGRVLWPLARLEKTADGLWVIPLRLFWAQYCLNELQRLHLGQYDYMSKWLTCYAHVGGSDDGDDPGDDERVNVSQLERIMCKAEAFTDYGYGRFYMTVMPELPRPERIALPTENTCPCCGDHFAKRKGTKYCSDNCRKLTFKHQSKPERTDR